MPQPSTPANEASGPYCRAATFRDGRQAGRIYQRVRDLLFATLDTDLSAYRFYLGPTWYVAVLGEPPDGDLDHQLGRLLERGVPTALPSEFIETLMQRRAEATELGSWVEGHYGPEADES